MACSGASAPCSLPSLAGNGGGLHGAGSQTFALALPLGGGAGDAAANQIFSYYAYLVAFGVGWIWLSGDFSVGGGCRGRFGVQHDTARARAVSGASQHGTALRFGVPLKFLPSLVEPGALRPQILAGHLLHLGARHHWPVHDISEYGLHLRPRSDGKVLFRGRPWSSSRDELHLIRIFSTTVPVASLFGGVVSFSLPPSRNTFRCGRSGA